MLLSPKWRLTLKQRDILHCFNATQIQIDTTTLFEVRHKKTHLKIFVLVISKEGWASTVNIIWGPNGPQNAVLGLKYVAFSSFKICVFLSHVSLMCMSVCITMYHDAWTNHDPIMHLVHQVGSRRATTNIFNLAHQVLDHDISLAEKLTVI